MYIHFGCRNIVVPAYLRLSIYGELLERVPGQCNYRPFYMLVRMGFSDAGWQDCSCGPQ